ncbi:MAG: ATP-binding cassette domain-containing protein, partial [Eggerthellaceae bacterium]|nr:ATP-binding cassette domain-containing protein [Eggerthellaceae bacterium]
SIMAMRPSVLILDEPTSQLDPIAASDFLNTVRKINTELGTTVIITEHRLEDIYAFADQVAVMDEGRLVAQGPPREVGEALFAAQHDMVYALPAPMRIYYGVVAQDAHVRGVEAADVPTEQNAAGLVPLTVREGRTWLSARCEALPPGDRKAVSLPTLSPSVEGDQPAVGDKGTVLVSPSSVSDKPVVEVDEVWFRYERDLPDVLKGISLSVSPATTFAIVGGNGVGKSTLLKALSAQVKPYRGVVRLLGKKVADWKSAELFGGALSMLPQDPANLFAKRTVREELEEMLEGDVQDGQDAASRIDQVAETCDIARLMDSHPLDLSGGEQQRAALAKVLMCEPRVLLLDEPTKGIDNFFKRKLASVLDDLKAQGRTIVMVSHDVEFCARYADEVAMLFNGTVSASGTPRRFFSEASFYTTAANRMSRHVFEGAIVEEDVVQLCQR